jgi:nucleoid DNA-binding protein
MATQKKAPAKKAPAKKAAAKKAPAKKAAVKKAPVKKAAAKKAPAKKAAAAPVKKAPGIKAKMTKTAILNEIATNTTLSRAQVSSVMDELESVIERHIRKRSVGEFTLPGLLKIKAAKRPATKKRMGRNPATGEEIVIPAKPATTRVRVTALKKLKDMIV